MSSVRTWLKLGSIAVGTQARAFVKGEWGERYLVKALSEMPGLPAKMGQYLALKYRKLEWLNQAPNAMPMEWVSEQIRILVPDLFSQIDEISEPLTASIAQVHEVRLKSGERLAVKLRFPDIDSAMKTQLKILMAGFKNFPMAKLYGMNFDDYESFLGDFYTEEINLIKEAQTQTKFRVAYQSFASVEIPEVYLNWTSSQVMTTRWIASTSLLDTALKSPPSQEIAHVLQDFFMKSLFVTGRVHTDLHSRNLGWKNESHQLVIYDFGATLILSSEIVQILSDFRARSVKGTRYSRDEAFEAFQSLGFNSASLIQLSVELPEVIFLIFSPLGLKFRAVNYQLDSGLDELLGSKKWIFRMAGPSWFFMLIKGVQTFLSTMRSVEEAPLEGIPIQKPTETHLRVRVMEGEAEIVDLEMPPDAASRLADLIPDHVLEVILSQKIDLTEVQNRAVSSSYQAQELFAARSGNRSYRVWLE